MGSNVAFRNQAHMPLRKCLNYSTHVYCSSMVSACRDGRKIIFSGRFFFLLVFQAHICGIICWMNTASCSLKKPEVQAFSQATVFTANACELPAKKVPSIHANYYSKMLTLVNKCAGCLPFAPLYLSPCTGPQLTCMDHFFPWIPCHLVFIWVQPPGHQRKGGE